LIVANHGPDVATNVVLTHTEPAEMDTLVGVTTQGTYDETTHTWTIGTLEPEGEVVLFLSARPLIGSGGREITLDASVEADQEDPSPARDSATVTIVGADILVVDKRVS